MKGFYLVCFLLSFSLFLWQSVSDARQSVVQRTALLIVIISNGGYLALAGASNLTEAVLATKILYVAACFLPMFYFITVCEVCRVRISRFLLAMMRFSQTHYHGVSSGGHEHEKITTFVQGGKTYDGMIHTLQNYYGKRSGFVVELRDETEHYQALELFEHYNQKLTEEVDVKTQQIASIQEKIILGMAQIIESRDLSTGGHIKRTSTVVRIFADELLKADMGFDPAFLHLVVRSAPMHDLGKIGVDDAVLRKQGKFTPEEYAKMKEHPAIGARIVKEVLTDVEAPDFVAVAVNVAHYHHEKVDGTGYPCGLKGTEIPVEARIMALADVFDALVSKRCYKEAFSFDKAFSIIAQDAGTHFDPELARVFLRCRPQLEHFYQEQEKDHEQV